MRAGDVRSTWPRWRWWWRYRGPIRWWWINALPAPVGALFGAWIFGDVAHGLPIAAGVLAFGLIAGWAQYRVWLAKAGATAAGQD